MIMMMSLPFCRQFGNCFQYILLIRSVSVCVFFPFFFFFGGAICKWTRSVGFLLNSLSLSLTHQCSCHARTPSPPTTHPALHFSHSGIAGRSLGWLLGIWLAGSIDRADWANQRSRNWTRLYVNACQNIYIYSYI